METKEERHCLIACGLGAAGFLSSLGLAVRMIEVLLTGLSY